MEQFFGKISLFVHIAAGATTLLAGPVAIFYNFKNPRRHRLAGKIFFYAMLVVVATAWLGYFKHPEAVFFQFLLGVATIVFAGVLRGVRAIQFMQGSRQPGAWDFGYTLLLGGFGLWMAVKALWHFQHGTMIAFPILFALFGLMALDDTVRNFRLFSRPAGSVDKLVWYRLHVGTMLGAFTASTTAFTVNAAHFLPWYLQWFGPALALLPLQIYFARKIKRQQKTAQLAAAG